jgi:hypothetical protein
MTQRERVLASSLLGIVVLGGGALLAQVAFLGPLRQLNVEIASLDEEIRKKDDELKADQAIVDRALKLSPRLAQWKQLSLPAPKDLRPEEVLLHLKTLQVDYEHYLYELLRRNGFAAGTIDVTSRPIEAPRTTSGTAKGSPPVLRPLPFKVHGQGSLDNLVKVLEEFHRASLLQQIRSIDVQKPQDRNAVRGTLDVNMTIEALLVSGAERRDDLMPATSSAARPHVLAESSRSYAELAAHNIFTGTSPATPKVAAQSEEARDVLGFVKLTIVDDNFGRRWEAWLNDQSKKDGMSRLRTTAGFNEFSYSDRYDNVLVKGVVIRIDGTGVLFKTNGRFHHIGRGENLYDALREQAPAPLPAAGAVLGAAWAAPW